MGLLQLKPRPLARDVTDFRDDRLFIVACDDTFAPEQYFNFFKLDRVKFHVVPTEDGTSHAAHVLERLMSYQCREDDERWMLLDTDHCIEGGHVKSYIRALRAYRARFLSVRRDQACIAQGPPRPQYCYYGHYSLCVRNYRYQENTCFE